MKRSVTIARHRTSISLEEPFWQALSDIAGCRGMSVSAVIVEIDQGRSPGANLSSAIRIFVLDWYRTRGCNAGGTRDPPTATVEA